LGSTAGVASGATGTGSGSGIGTGTSSTAVFFDFLSFLGGISTPSHSYLV
jgi:hypothetical protein